MSTKTAPRALGHGDRATRADFEALPEGPPYYELYNGILYMSPAPAFHHQDIQRILLRLLFSYFDAHPGHKVVLSPTDIAFTEDTVLQPDLFVLSASQYAASRAANAVEGIPPLVIEIISPANTTREQVRKREIYERAGVQEYWIVNPADQSIAVLALEEGHYTIHSDAYHNAGSVTSRYLPGLAVELAHVFGEPPKNA